MAAPHTSGTAARAAGEFPGLIERPAALKRLVMATGQPAPLTRGKTVTGDIVNADKVFTDTTPTIRASVVDLQELLGRSDLEVRVDNVLRNFSYKANSGTLSLPGSRMKEGRHSVEITAADPQNPATTKRWTFRME